LNDKGFKTLLAINFILLVADFISTLLCGKLVKYLEVNLLYKYGGLTLILLVNFMIGWYMFWAYTRSKAKVGDRFFIILSLCMLIGFRLLAIYGNLTVAFVEPQEIAEYHNVSYEQGKLIQLEMAKTMTEELKREYARDFITPFIMPYLCMLAVWLFFKIDHNIERRLE